MHDDHTDALSELVLIDWEWMGFGTTALDVARLWATLPALCDRAEPCPEATFSSELLDYYLDRYRAYGGRQIDPSSWRRECALAMLAHALSQVRFIGSVLRHDPYAVLPTLERQLEIVLEAAWSLRAE
jgi:thiamine kinase-like enzyme